MFRYKCKVWLPREKRERFRDSSPRLAILRPDDVTLVDLDPVRPDQALDPAPGGRRAPQVGRGGVDLVGQRATSGLAT